MDDFDREVARIHRDQLLIKALFALVFIAVVIGGGIIGTLLAALGIWLFT